MKRLLKNMLNKKFLANCTVAGMLYILPALSKAQISEKIIRDVNIIKKSETVTYSLNALKEKEKVLEKIDSFNSKLFRGNIKEAEKIAKEIEKFLEKNDEIRKVALLKDPYKIYEFYYAKEFIRTVNDLAKGNLNEYYKFAEKAMKEAYKHKTFEKYFRENREIHGFIVYDSKNKVFYIDTFENAVLKVFKNSARKIEEFAKQGKEREAIKELRKIYELFKPIFVEIEKDYIYYYIIAQSSKNEKEKEIALHTLKLLEPFLRKNLEKTFKNYSNIDEKSKKYMEMLLSHLASAHPYIYIEKLREIVNEKGHYIVSMFHTHISNKRYVLYPEHLQQEIVKEIKEYETSAANTEKWNSPEDIEISKYVPNAVYVIYDVSGIRKGFLLHREKIVFGFDLPKK